MNNSIILIPALDPPESLIKYINSLSLNGFKNIIVIDDGSHSEYQPLFSELEKIKGCVVLRHAINLGKGRALKTGFNYYLTHYSDCTGLITVDSDGQHAIENVIDMANVLKNHQKSLILGCRDFNKEIVPFKSKFGNKLTSKLFCIFFGLKISDTQTGLRGFTNDVLKLFLDLPGERFEYETNMLIEAQRKNVDISEIPIDTIYMDSNSSTHFHPIKDSIRIYSLLLKEFLKFSMISILSFALDIILFQIFTLFVLKLPLSIQIFVATFGARVLSSLFNCFSNWKIVFHSNTPIKKMLVKYYLLCLMQMLCSAAIVFACVNALQLPRTLIKIVIDSLLFFVSFSIQKKYIYHEK